MVCGRNGKKEEKKRTNRALDRWLALTRQQEPLRTKDQASLRGCTEERMPRRSRKEKIETPGNTKDK